MKIGNPFSLKPQQFYLDEKDRKLQKFGKYFHEFVKAHLGQKNNGK